MVDTDDGACVQDQYNKFCKGRFDSNEGKVDTLIKEQARTSGVVESMHGSITSLAAQLGNGGGLQEKVTKYGERIKVIEAAVKIKSTNGSLARDRLFLAGKIAGIVAILLAGMLGVNQGVPIITGEANTQKEIVSTIEKVQQSVVQVQSILENGGPNGEGAVVE